MRRPFKSYRCPPAASRPATLARCTSHPCALRSKQAQARYPPVVEVPAALSSEEISAPIARAYAFVGKEMARSAWAAVRTSPWPRRRPAPPLCGEGSRACQLGLRATRACVWTCPGLLAAGANVQCAGQRITAPSWRSVSSADTLPGESASSRNAERSSAIPSRAGKGQAAAAARARCARPPSDPYPRPRRIPKRGPPSAHRNGRRGQGDEGQGASRQLLRSILTERTDGSELIGGWDDAKRGRHAG
jgi:hypothetical protein